MKQSQDSSPLEILITVELQIILTPITEEDILYFRAVMLLCPRDQPSLWYTLDAEVLSANHCFRSGKVSDASLELLAYAILTYSGGTALQAAS